MTLGESLIPEFNAEMAHTRRFLEVVPDSRFDWKPHDRCSSLGKLSNHIAQAPLMALVILQGMAKKQPEQTSAAGLLEMFDLDAAKARLALTVAQDDYFTSIVMAGTPNANTRLAFFRSKVFNHTVHHRGQLSVYLRMLDVELPG